jgi:Uma2 family endonuclease
LHIRVAMLLARRIVVALHQADYFVGVQTTLHLSRHNAPSPDLYVLFGGPPEGEVPAERIALVIEVADTSLKDDLTDSASRYARHGVRDFWVVDVNARVVHVHRQPEDGVYRDVQVLGADARLAALLVPELVFTLDDAAPA